MSLDLYHYHAVVRQQEVIRRDRLAADEQVGRMAQALSDLGRAVAGIAGRRGRRAAATLAARRTS